MTTLPVDGFENALLRAPSLILRNLRLLARLELDEDDVRLFYYAHYLPSELESATLYFRKSR
jgi:hypothetical protein